MRGGDRLVNECSWMSGICFSFYHSTYCCGDFKRSPPLISLFCQSVPKCRLPKNPASPRGVAERSESFKIMIAGGNHSMIKKPRSASPLAVHKLLVRTVYYSQRVRSSKCFLKSLCCGRILSAPTVPGAKRRAGRLLVDPYRKHIQNRLPGGSGHQRIRTISVASLSGGTAARRQLTVC